MGRIPSRPPSSFAASSRGFANSAAGLALSPSVTSMFGWPFHLCISFCLGSSLGKIRGKVPFLTDPVMCVGCVLQLTFFL